MHFLGGWTDIGRSLRRLVNPRRHFCAARIYSILIFAMAKRKPAAFSATKAVKANARERVGQPKPSRILPDKPRTGRKAKHKPKLDEIMGEEQ